MKTEVPLSSLMHVLPRDMAGQIREFVDPDDPSITVRRKGAVDIKSKTLDPGEREVLQYVSTRDVDRDGEILNPSGAVLTEFKKAPQVLWGHDYSIPPVGSDRTIEKDGYGILAVTRYAKTDLGNDLWILRRDGHLNTSSVGFIPMKMVRKGEDGWSKLTEKLSKDWDQGIETFEKANAIIDKWLLLEHSDVAVPANINARTVAVGKDEEAKALTELCTKGVIKTASVRDAVMKFIAEIVPKIPDPEPEPELPPAPNCGIIVELPPERSVEIITRAQECRVIQIIEAAGPPPDEKARALVMLLRGQLG